MKQVLDIKQMQHLQELGLELKETMLYWVVYEVGHENNFVTTKENAMEVIDESCGMLPAYTLQDVLELLPGSVNWNRLLITFNGCECMFQYAIYEGDPIVAFHNEEMIDAAYEMLCWCIENVKTNKEDGNAK